MSLPISLTLDENNPEQIVELIEKYSALVDKAEGIFELENRTLEEVERTQPKYYSAYAQYMHEVKGIEEWLSIQLERRQGDLWKRFNEGYSRQLTQKDMQMYVNADVNIIKDKQLLLAVGTLKSKLDAVVKALDQMGYQLTNMTKLRVEQMHKEVL